VLEQLFYHSENEYLVVHHDVLDGPAWLDDGLGKGHTVEDIRRDWPELAKAARLY
jgi:hypothetical protein